MKLCLHLIPFGDIAIFFLRQFGAMHFPIYDVLEVLDLRQIIPEAFVS